MTIGYDKKNKKKREYDIRWQNNINEQIFIYTK